MTQWKERAGEDMIKQVGYAVEDLNGDAVPELLIGYNGEKQNLLQDGMIYALYALDGDKPELVFQSENRNTYYRTKDGILNIGSAGAIYSIFGIATLSADNTLIWKDFVYTHEIDGDFERIGVYRNTTGEMNDEADELTDMTLDDFFQMSEKSEKNVFQPELIPISEYMGDVDNSGIGSSWIEIGWAENMPEFPAVRDTVVLSEDEPATDILIKGGNIRDLKLLSLFLSDENGAVNYNPNVVYEYGELAEDTPLIITVSFYGDLPSWGISYTDDNGDLHHFALLISGDDGSLVLQEFSAIDYE